jgi:transposase-like protein
MERRRFTAEFKREAVKLAGQEGVSRTKVAQELGLNVNMLGRWVRAGANRPSFLFRFRETRIGASFRTCLFQYFHDLAIAP